MDKCTMENIKIFLITNFMFGLTREKKIWESKCKYKNYINDDKHLASWLILSLKNVVGLCFSFNNKYVVVTLTLKLPFKIKKN